MSLVVAGLGLLLVLRLVLFRLAFRAHGVLASGICKVLRQGRRWQSGVRVDASRSICNIQRKQPEVPALSTKVWEFWSSSFFRGMLSTSKRERVPMTVDRSLQFRFLKGIVAVSVALFVPW